MKDFVYHVLEPCRWIQIKLLKLSKTQRMVWLIDWWKVHTFKEFIKWMKEEYLLIFLIFIPTNYKAIFQPIDIIIQRLFKYAFKQQFEVWASKTITN
jgi:hypothetical protein